MAIKPGFKDPNFKRISPAKMKRLLRRIKSEENSRIRSFLQLQLKQ